VGSPGLTGNVMPVDHKHSNPGVGFLLRLAVISLALLFSAVFVPLLFGWKPAVITSGSMKPSLQVGDVVLIDTHDKRFGINDVITFDRAGRSVTHRVVGMRADGTWRTKGDANGRSDSESVPSNDVVGQVRFVVPLVGLPALHPEIVVGMVGALLLYAFRGSVGRVHRRERLSIAWNATCEKVAMAGVLSAVATASIGTTLTSSVFMSSTSSAADFTSRDGYYSAVKALGPQSYWRLGELSGTTAADAQGLLNGTYAASVTNGVAAPLSHDNDTAISCVTGTTCFSTADNNAFHNTGAQSIALWFKPSTASQSSNARVLAKYDGTNITYFIAYNGTNGQMRYLVDVNSRITAQSTTLLTNTNTWSFIVGTWDGSTARIYINGTQEGTATGTGPVKQNTSGFVGLGTAGGTAGARGSLDDVAIWDRALTPAEITNLYTLATT
jgi:signal peptidase I